MPQQKTAVNYVPLLCSVRAVFSWTIKTSPQSEALDGSSSLRFKVDHYSKISVLYHKSVQTKEPQVLRHTTNQNEDPHRLAQE